MALPLGVEYCNEKNSILFFNSKYQYILLYICACLCVTELCMYLYIERYLKNIIEMNNIHIYIYIYIYLYMCIV